MIIRGVDPAGYAMFLLSKYKSSSELYHSLSEMQLHIVLCFNGTNHSKDSLGSETHHREDSDEVIEKHVLLGY